MKQVWSRVVVAVAAAHLVGCATMHEAQSSPERVYHSHKSRDAVANCLIDRLADSNLRVHRNDEYGRTWIKVSGSLIAITYFAFVLRDEGSGTSIAMRRANRMAAGLGNAETCF